MTITLVALLVVSTLTLARAGNLSIVQEGAGTIFYGSLIQWFGIATLVILRLV